MLGLTLLVGAAAVLLDRRLRRAVKALIAATRAIADGERDPELRVGTGDELDLLGQSVKDLAGALQNTETRVKHWHQELEATVAKRTRQLEDSQQLLTQREKMAAVGLMAAGIVHEVGNPLAAMSAIVQRIDRQAGPKLRTKCTTLHQQIERISKILHEMRQVSRPATRSRSLVDVNALLHQVIKICRYDPRSKNVRISTNLDADVPRIPGNPDRWQQVFLNLIINAFEAMPNGGKLAVSSAVVDDGVDVIFRDDGVGMTPQQVRNLYHPFYTTKSNGTGLGLSVCQGIVRSYGGDICVRSQLGQGSEFRVVIPKHAQDSSGSHDSLPADSVHLRSTDEPGLAQHAQPATTKPEITG